MNTALHYHLAGMGATPATAIAGGVAQGVSTTVSQIIHGQYVSGVGTALLTASLIPTPATPFLAIAGAVAELLGAIGIGKGCGNTCIVATEYANQAGALMQQNLDTYMSLPAPRYKSAQTAALGVFDNLWAGLISPQACGNPQLGDPGKRCIGDRQRGSCAYKTSPGAGCQPSQSNCWTQDSSGNCTFNPGGPNGSGNACWNYFVGFRDPIANDPCVVPDTVTSNISSAVSNLSSSTGISPTLLMIGGAAAVLLFMVSES